VNTLEDRLRGACRAVAEAVQAEPIGAFPKTAPTPTRATGTRTPLPGPTRAGSAGQLGGSPGRGGSRAVRWLTPAAAAVAMVGVIIAASLTSRAGGHQPTSQATPQGMPRYYVVLNFGVEPAPIRSLRNLKAIVHDSVTGRALASVPVPIAPIGSDSPYLPSVAASNDDKHFVILANERVPGGTAAALFELRIGDGGRSASLNRLAVRFPAWVLGTSLALSPDGSELAVTDVPQPWSRYSKTQIQVVSLATGGWRTWTVPTANLQPADLSWADDEHLVFLLVKASLPSASYHMLDVTAAGSDLADTEPLAAAQELPEGFPAGFITPGGRDLITSTARNVPDRDGRTTVVARIVELSARTGQLLRVLYQTSQLATRADPVVAMDEQCKVISPAPSAQRALLACFGFGRLANGRFTPLPGITSPQSLWLPNIQGMVAW
jgi:hypothetical protein